MMEAMGLIDAHGCFTRSDGTQLGPKCQEELSLAVERAARLITPAKVGPRDLEQVIGLHYNSLPMRVRADYIPLTDSVAQTDVTVQFDPGSLQFRDQGAGPKALVNLYARVATMARQPVLGFEDKMELGPSATTYQKTTQLKPGRYRLVIAAKDLGTSKQTIYEMVLEVPRVDDAALGTSSLILADAIDPLPATGGVSAPFTIGGSKIRRRADNTFSREETLGMYLQAYNFKPDAKGHKPHGTIRFEFRKADANAPDGAFVSDSVAAVEGCASQVSVARFMSLWGFEPGLYTVTATVLDSERNQTVSRTATFTVR
jgi:hypothetical protein